MERERCLCGEEIVSCPALRALRFRVKFSVRIFGLLLASVAPRGGVMWWCMKGNWRAEQFELLVARIRLGSCSTTWGCYDWGGNWKTPGGVHVCVCVFERETFVMYLCGEESVPYPAPRVLRIRVKFSVFWFTSPSSCSKERSLCGGV